MVSGNFSGLTKALVTLIRYFSFISIRKKGEIEKRRNVIWSSGINHFHSAIINTGLYWPISVFVLCILLIQLTKVHGPKHPTLVFIYFCAKLRKISVLPWMSCSQCIVTTQNQCIREVNQNLGMKTNRIITNHRKLMKIIQIHQDPLRTTVKKQQKTIRTKDHHTAVFCIMITLSNHNH